MKMRLTRRGRQLDEVTVDGDKLSYATGRARPVVDALLARGFTPTAMVGHTNGEYALEPGPEHTTWATWAGADVLATLPDLPDA